MGKKTSIVEPTDPEESEAPATEPEAQDTKIAESDEKTKGTAASTKQERQNDHTPALQQDHAGENIQVLPPPQVQTK